MSTRKYNEGRLSCLFQSALDRQQERIEELGTSVADRKLIEAGISQARQVLDGATDLVGGKSVRQAKSAWQILLDSGGSEGGSPIREGVLLAIDGRLGEEALRMQVAAEARFNHLLAFAQEQGVGFYTRETLYEISRCYLFGFDYQCIILCRAAIEAAFFDHNIGTGDTLAQRIKWLKDQGGNLAKIASAAKFVSNAANDLLHADRRALNRTLAEDRTRKILMSTVIVVKFLAELRSKAR